MARGERAGGPPPKMPGETAGGGATEVTAGESSEEKPKRSRRPRDGLAVKGGRREMKAYTVTEDQLENLGILQFSSTFVLSLSASLFTFWIGVHQNVAFSDGKNQAAERWWQGLATGALVAAILLLAVGCALIFRGKSTVGKIKRDTIHD